MYLDDIILIADTFGQQGLQHHQAHIGPAAWAYRRQKKKPSTNVKWLGITIDSKEMTLSIPSEKIKEVKVSKAQKSPCQWSSYNPS